VIKAEAQSIKADTLAIKADAQAILMALAASPISSPTPSSSPSASPDTSLMARWEEMSGALGPGEMRGDSISTFSSIAYSGEQEFGCEILVEGATPVIAE
jgi:hypothetical protein